MKSLLKKVTSRLFLVILSMVLQIIVIVVMMKYFIDKIVFVYTVYLMLTVIVALRIILGTRHPAYKIAWLVPFLIFPLFGVLLYVIFGVRYRLPGQKRRDAKIRGKISAAYSENVVPRVNELSFKTNAAAQSAYIKKVTGEPPYEHTDTEFIAPGEEVFERMLLELEKAEKYIFAEYFIFASGKMLDRFINVLSRKARDGVDVRIIYDDLGTMRFVPGDFQDQLERSGIRCGVYHRVTPLLTGGFNTRDHRKILVIDGKVGFTGGINIADEYINGYEKFGHWLDCGIVLRGDAVWTMTVQFLSMWDHVARADEDYETFLPEKEFRGSVYGRGVVQPFSDEPVDDEPVGENVYINMISRARRYIYICTPYLVVGEEILRALTNAAKSGIDVRIITPGIPDKAYVYVVTRSYYAALIKAGARIFEYTPGFIHSKTFVSDDQFAVCGSINLDFRSLYLQHESAVWMYDAKAVGQMYDHYLEILPQCREITREWCDRTPWYKRLGRSLLRVFAPLM